jgi:hypothetical protein
MSLFIHPDNQELLWKTIHTISQIHPSVQFIERMEPSAKIQWFKSVIQLFHERNPLVDSFEDLKQTNSQTLQYICDFIRNAESPPPPPTKEYGNPDKPPVANEPQFKDTQDEPIRNMEELIEKHKMERELMEREIKPFGELEAPLATR